MNKERVWGSGDGAIPGQIRELEDVSWLLIGLFKIGGLLTLISRPPPSLSLKEMENR